VAKAAAAVKAAAVAKAVVVVKAAAAGLAQPVIHRAPADQITLHQNSEVEAEQSVVRKLRVVCNE
jgi:hypothetical protein